MEDNECPECPQLPGWLATFADLMSLLMCFFVLLLSFSEMDVQKYKRVAGSMKFAFGVQREVQAKQIPKGTSIIAQEFSAGKPVPTIVKSVQQITTEQYKQNLDFNDSDSSNNKSSGEESSGNQTTDVSAGESDTTSEVVEQTEAFTEAQLQAIAEARLEAMQDEQLKIAMEMAQELVAMQQQQQQPGEPPVRISEGQVQRRLKEAAEARAESKLELVKRRLENEIEEGLVEVVREGNKVVVRLRERGFFNTARAKINNAFQPVLARVGRALSDVPGDLVVSGHTDNVPISNDEFRSNWELSAARAANVVHYLTTRGGIAKDRVEMRAHAEVKPIADNATAENRARNRRVEVVITDTGAAVTPDGS
ncbi:MAG: flagellar motor protein MotB [Pseudomonadota bacterium]